MALPFQFSNVTTLVTSQLDANYNALGALTPIPCTVSGTNTITMTPAANTPTVSVFSNYMQFTGIAAATNTGPTTIAVGGSAALPAYKDTIIGPSILSGNEIVLNCVFAVLYDSALNAGGGGFHLISEDLSGIANLINIVGGPVSIGWPNIPASSASISTVGLTGCSVGDVVTIGTPASVPTGITFFGWVSGVGTVTVEALNVTAGSITPVAGTYRVTAQRYTP